MLEAIKEGTRNHHIEPFLGRDANGNTIVLFDISPDHRKVYLSESDFPDGGGGLVTAMKTSILHTALAELADRAQASRLKPEFVEMLRAAVQDEHGKLPESLR